MNKTRSRLHIFSKKIKSKIMQPKNLPLFLFPFLFLPANIPPIILTHLILSHIFSSTLLLVRLNRTFDSLIQFSLVIFNLQTPAVAFGLPDHHTPLLCHPPLAPCSRLPSFHSSPLKTVAPHRPPFSILISYNQCHWSFIAAAFFPLTFRRPMAL
jgi:hypothetical protein